MRVYRDFFAYKEGVYKHSAASRADEGGFHSVRLVGWGVERNGPETTKYWVIRKSSFSKQKKIEQKMLLFSDRRKQLGYMVGRKWLLPDTTRIERM